MPRHGDRLPTLRDVRACADRHPAVTIALWRAFVLAVIVLVALEVRALALYPVLDTPKLAPAPPAAIASVAEAAPPLSARAGGWEDGRDGAIRTAGDGL